MSLIRKAFSRLHYPIDVIALCVRWYLAYSLSLRNLEEMMAERGVIVDHSTLHRWVIRLVPLLVKAFRRHKRPVGRRWRMDETYIKIKGQWKYLYRAVDTAGQTIDFLLTAKRDAVAAQRKAIRHHGEPEAVTIDKSGANTAALTTLNAGNHSRSTADKGDDDGNRERGIEPHFGIDTGNNGECDSFRDQSESNDNTGQHISTDVTEPVLTCGGQQHFYYPDSYFPDSGAVLVKFQIQKASQGWD